MTLLKISNVMIYNILEMQNTVYTPLKISNDNVGDTTKIIYLIGGLSIIGTIGFVIRMNIYRKEFNFLRSIYTR